MTDRVCVVDTSAPLYAAPLARECVVTVEASADSVSHYVAFLERAGCVLFVGNLVLAWFVLAAVQRRARR